ncbi:MULTISPECIES: NADPH-dependent F420 reductase [Mumia]|uniref:NADPH-dependent F420 reductase n=1 Tax=Mumia TaxID=1546255 RepID=UPI00141E4714|nr:MULTISPECIES: NADPH-dependent F420 reductase [unclassified Mumia]QMW64853.1 NADPH-dependent F420 reductase [Mumia sp. ZJ1417]
MTTIGLIGSGHIGSQVARAAIAQGYDVVLSNSRGPETLKELVDELGPQARAGTPQDAAEAADLAVVATPLSAIATIPVEPLAGKVVIDTNNYYPQRDGQFAALDDESTTVSELLQQHLPESKVVKAFNHIAWMHISEHAKPSGTEGRRALAIAGDDAEAKATVAAFIDRTGFDVVDLGPLSEGWRTQRDTPAYVAPFTADELKAKIAEAKRYRDM